jgi:hypothetical protein
MQRAIQSQWKLATPPEPADVADALAVALCCGQALSGVLVPATKPHRRPRVAARNKDFVTLIAARGLARHGAGR